MSQQNIMSAEVFPAGVDPDGEEQALLFEDINYISFVSSPGGNSGGTYGIPAIIADAHVKDEGLPVTVLYVNPANVAALLVTRTQ